MSRRGGARFDPASVPGGQLPALRRLFAAGEALCGVLAAAALVVLLAVVSATDGLRPAAPMDGRALAALALSTAALALSLLAAQRLDGARRRVRREASRREARGCGRSSTASGRL